MTYSLQRLSIRTQIFLLVLAIVLPVLGMLAWFLAAEVRHAREAAQDKVRLLADTSATRLLLTLGDYREMLRRMAERPSVRALDARSFDPVISETIRLHPEFNNLGVRDRNGRAVYTFRPNASSAEEIRQLPWFGEGLRNEAFTAGNAFAGRLSGRWVSVLTYPIRDDSGRVAGLINTPVDLLRLSERIFQGIPPNSVATVIDREGVTLLRSKAAEQFIGKPSHPQAEKAVEGRSEGYLSLPGVDGVQMLYFFKYLPGVKWRIVAGLPESEIFAEFYATLWRSLAAGLGVLLLAVALAWRIGLSIVGAMTGLASTAARVAAGDKSARADLSGPTEVAATARQFNAMLEASEVGEAALREGEMRTRLLLKASDVGMWDWNLVTGEVYFSAEWKRHLGYADSEIPDRFEEWKLRVHPDDLDRTMMRVTDFREGRRAEYDAEFRMRHRDGSWRWIYSQADFVRNAAGEPVRMLGSHIDITERKRREQALRDSEQQLRLALRGADLAFWDLDPGAGTLITNARWLEILGLDAGTVPTLELWRSLVHPRDRQKMTRLVGEITTNPAVPDFEVEVRARHSDGHYVWILDKGSIVERGADGRALRIVGTHMDITERKQREEELLRFRAAMDVSADAIYLTDRTTLRFLDINAAVCEGIGRTREEVLALGPAGVLGVPQDELEHIYDSVISSNGRFPLAEMWRTGSAGEQVCIEVRHHALRSGEGWLIVTVTRDITARKAAEQALRASEGRFRELLQNIPSVAVQGYSFDGITQYWNIASEQLYGYSAAEAVGRNLLELIIPDEMHEGVREAMRHMAASGEVIPAGELSLRRKDGSRVQVYSSHALVQIPGREPEMFCIDIDLTERRRAEAEREVLEGQLRESQKMEAVGTLAGGVAHDFNNIIATILGNAELAREDARANPVALQSLEEIRKAGSRARDLVQQILSFSRRQPTELRPLALGPVLEESVRLLRATLPARLTLQVHCDADVPPVLADATQVQQVIINLATNAMQAMRGGPGCIDIRLDTVALDGVLAATHPRLQALHQKHPGRTVRLVVHDSGAGMDEATLARIFEPFFTTKAVDEGTGLGLSVVLGIVQTHGGAIVVESDPGHGATFSVYLPPADATDTAQPGAAGPPAVTKTPPAAPGVSGLRLLYIDDDESLVFLVTRLLSRRGYKVSGFTDQAGALALLRADPALFDLVLTDYNMPGMSGLDVARAVRSIRASLPVAVASGFIDETLRAEAAGAGVRELIFKADSVEEFCEAVQRLAEPRPVTANG